MNDNFSRFKTGMKDGVPVLLGYFAVSFTFGIKAVGNGITPLQALIFSIANVTSAGQFAGLDMIAYGAPYLELAFAQLVINLRYCLMSCTLSQKLDREVNPLHRFIMGYAITDEILALSAMQPGKLSPYYLYGLAASAIPGWGAGTIMGALCGNILPASILSALGIAIYGMFLAIILPVAKQQRVVRLVVIAAMALSLMFNVIPALSRVSSGFQIIIITLAIAGAAAWLFPLKEAGADEQ